ncbi:MAG: glycosyltransferase family 2 protein [Bacteroidales bacterium]|nr:glycosyltransferase family 2 protein [Bacteroidales bacterium]
MELSVIIVSYNVRHFLEQCLLSVKKASENIDCEIFVVDNNSADGSCAMVSREFPKVKLIINHVNKGFSAANNQAIVLAKGRYILLLNPDTIVEEDTFSGCIGFMDNHPDAGALGVKMIDGKGRVLPESKRSLPTPKTAFFKIFGFSFLFPKSRIFNRYYLGHLDSQVTTKADIISGAFMFLRREAVQKTGFLDEDFFMYGEDIDFSYRLMKAGFNNYYFPERKIIHYKGESTKKENLNVLVYFYKAMLIFVRKHFGNSSYKSFIFLIQLAIFFRAGLSLLKRFLRRIFLPLTDAALIYFIYQLIIPLWASYRFGGGYKYPGTFTEIIVPFYTLTMVLAITLASGYSIPAKISGAAKGVIAGTLIILVIYALLPLELRFSRAIIIIAGALSLLVIPLCRALISLTNWEIAENPFLRVIRTAIAASAESYSKVRKLISETGVRNIVCGRISINKEDIQEEVLGNIKQIREVIKVNRIKEVIFTTSELSASQIIDSMHLISDCNVRIRIAPEGEKYILGSKYIRPDEGIIQFDRPSFREKILEKIKDWFNNLFK